MPINRPITATVSVPGSKSYSLRALIIAALCEDGFEIHNLLDSTDVSAMQNSLLEIKDQKSNLYVNESGVTARFLAALACVTPREQTIDGAPGLKQRPIADLVEALRQLGANIKYLEKDGFLPISVSSADLSGSKVNVGGNISSQYLSALLLIAPGLKNGLEITVDGEQVSKPYIDMTLDIMKHFGVEVVRQNYQKYIVRPQKYIAKAYEVESDYSSAAYFYAINYLTGSKIEIKNLNPDSKQGDKKFIDLLKQGLRSSSFNAINYPDQAMTLAVLLAFKSGKSSISGVKSLRVKESERVQAMQNELAKMGIKTESTENSLTIYGGNPRATNIDTYGDHRIAMSFAVAATKLTRLSIFSPEVVNKTFPGFWDELGKLTEVKISELEYSKIVLTGLRGTGKSTVGKLVAKRLGMDFVDVDNFIETKHQINIKQAVQKNGWEYFRKLEAEAIEEITKKSNLVISTGAGAVMFDKNAKNLKDDSLVFMLKADPKILAKRISRYKKLPALTKHRSVLAELEEVWKQRKVRYYSVSDFIIDTDESDPKAVAAQIIAKIKP